MVLKMFMGWLVDVVNEFDSDRTGQEMREAPMGALTTVWSVVAAPFADPSMGAPLASDRRKLFHNA